MFGKVIRSDSYFTQDSNLIYTSHTIEITKILKGDLECGTVELITQGGQANGQMLIVSHALDLRVGNAGVFLCDSSFREPSTLDFFQEDNDEILEARYENQSYIQYWWDGLNVRASDMWYDIDSLAQVYNLTQYLTNFTLIDCENDTILHHEFPDVKPKPTSTLSSNTYSHNTAQIKAFHELNAVKKKGINANTRDIQSVGLTFNITNPIVTGSTTKYFEFDVNISADSASYLNTAGLRVQYSTSMFGAFIEADTNIWITPGNAFSQYDAIAFDVSSNIVSFGLSAPFGATNMTALSSQFKKLSHIKMKIQNCGAGSVSFIHADTIAINCYYTSSPSGTDFYLFDNVVASQSVTVPACGLSITSFTPTVRNGGVNEVLEIHGHQFGDVRGSGNVYFKNAEDGGVTEVALDAYDFSNGIWSDTLIKIFLPSTNDTILSAGILTQKPQQVVGTGTFRVMNDANEVDVSDSFLTVHYSISNAKISGIQQWKTWLNLTAQDTSGGYTFYVDTALWNYPERLACVIKALDDWKCETGVNWHVESYIVPPVDSVHEDSVNTIQFGNSGSALGLTKQWSDVCNQLAYVEEIDLVLSNAPGIIWFSDTTAIDSVPVGQRDLYATLLHELGHAHSLNHVINPLATMHFAAPPATSAVPPLQRKIHLDSDISAVEGGQKIMERSLNAPYTCTIDIPIHIIPKYICILNGVQKNFLLPFEFNLS